MGRVPPIPGTSHTPHLLCCNIKNPAKHRTKHRSALETRKQSGERLRRRTRKPYLGCCYPVREDPAHCCCCCSPRREHGGGGGGAGPRARGGGGGSWIRRSGPAGERQSGGRGEAALSGTTRAASSFFSSGPGLPRGTELGRGPVARSEARVHWWAVLDEARRPRSSLMTISFKKKRKIFLSLLPSVQGPHNEHPVPDIVFRM